MFPGEVIAPGRSRTPSWGFSIGAVSTPSRSDDWLDLSGEPLPVEEASRWVARPDCGAVVVFTGLVRDHAEGRPGVSSLEYEAYTEAVLPRMADLVAEARRRWELGRVACLHRVGRLAVGEPAVVVAVSSGHRAAAFEAARWCIDTLKESVPIWKRESWEGGEDWGTGAQPLSEVRR
ncbi:molybdenum cofactor biosynthesis protein MoaE [Acidimicrobiaceae bacterium USS-CC1]|uniref:Molybdenum cofactor biosynthesis protein MoaE n=1 Tax=Acidiferrimicrobium australe TaxID=2664430 RepID=A0ABW9QU11_9ACTN|nr:molybdenum cofactor biosynthesis protein MoaE [Acidiferrimicrobium australe]